MAEVLFEAFLARLADRIRSIRDRLTALGGGPMLSGLEVSAFLIAMTCDEFADSSISEEFLQKCNFNDSGKSNDKKERGNPCRMCGNEGFCHC